MSDDSSKHTPQCNFPTALSATLTINLTKLRIIPLTLVLPGTIINTLLPSPYRKKFLANAVIKQVPAHRGTEGTYQFTIKKLSFCGFVALRTAITNHCTIHNS